MTDTRSAIIVAKESSFDPLFSLRTHSITTLFEKRCLNPLKNKRPRIFSYAIDFSFFFSKILSIQWMFFFVFIQTWSCSFCSKKKYKTRWRWILPSLLPCFSYCDWKGLLQVLNWKHCIERWMQGRINKTPFFDCRCGNREQDTDTSQWRGKQVKDCLEWKANDACPVCSVCSVCRKEFLSFFFSFVSQWLRQTDIEVAFNAKRTQMEEDVWRRESLSWWHGTWSLNSTWVKGREEQLFIQMIPPSLFCVYFIARFHWLFRSCFV